MCIVLKLRILVFGQLPLAASYLLIIYISTADTMLKQFHLLGHEFTRNCTENLHSNSFTFLQTVAMFR
jgi:hypothetical protein